VKDQSSSHPKDIDHDFSGSSEFEESDPQYNLSPGDK